MLRLLVPLVAVAFVVCNGMDVPMCSRDVCSCPAPNGALGDAVIIKDSNCMCSCGREEGVECNSDDHCVQGTTCTFAKDMSKTGVKQVCTNKCSGTKCPQYNRCELDSSNSPVCNSRIFTCEPAVVSPVTAVRDNKMQSFSNECEMVNANSELRLNDPNSSTWVPSSNK